MKPTTLSIVLILSLLVGVGLDVIIFGPNMSVIGILLVALFIGCVIFTASVISKKRPTG